MERIPIACRDYFSVQTVAPEWVIPVQKQKILKNQDQAIRMVSKYAIEDPEYAAKVIAKRKEANKKRCEQRKEQLAKLKEAVANGDEEAIKKLTDIRAYGTETTKKSRQRMYEAAENGDPEAVKRYDNYRQGRRDNYHRKKEGEAS